MSKEQLLKLIEDMVGKNIVESQDILNNEISKDILFAYDNEPNLSFNELVSTLLNSYMQSAAILGARAAIDVLINIGAIHIES